MPKTKLGKWSVILIVLMPILFFIGSSFTNTLYESVASGDTILQDISKRPALAITMLAGMASGILAFILGLIAIVNQRERKFPAFFPTALRALLILFLLGEIISPH